MAQGMDVMGLRKFYKNACVPFAPDCVIPGPIGRQEQHGSSNRGSLVQETLSLQRTGATGRCG